MSRPPASALTPDRTSSRVPRSASSSTSSGRSFARLYREHGPMVRGALRQLGVPLASIEDATQDVFVVLHRRAAEFDRDRSLRNWLWGIARGVASTYRRSDRRRRRLIGELPREHATASLERELARGEAVGILDRFLGALDPDKCAVFVLAEIEGRSGPEISRMLDVNVNTVYARLRAARRSFHEAVAEHHVPDTRPLFASWLPLLGWLRPAGALATAGALAVTLALPSMPQEGPPLTTLARATIPDVATSRPSPSEPRAVTRRPAPDPGTEPDIVIAIDEQPSTSAKPITRVRRRVRRDASIAAEPVEPTTAASASAPAERPWGDRVVARAPSPTHAPLIEPKRDFIESLMASTAGL